MVIATGFFDGVHIGHRFVIERLVNAARERGDQSMVVTFWPHPRNVLQDDARNLRLLTSLEEKKALLRGLGVDHVEVLPFTKEFSRLTTREYFRDILITRFGAKAILIGYDNRMGCDPQTPESIEKVAQDEGLDVIRLGSVASPAGVTVSSTKIRENIDNHRDISSLIDPVVQEYIYHKGMYLREPEFKPILRAKAIAFENPALRASETPSRQRCLFCGCRDSWP